MAREDWSEKTRRLAAEAAATLRAVVALREEVGSPAEMAAWRAYCGARAVWDHAKHRDEVAAEKRRGEPTGRALPGRVVADDSHNTV